MAALPVKDFNLVMETENRANKLTFQWSIRNMIKIPEPLRSCKFSLVSGQPREWDVSIWPFPNNTFDFCLAYHASKDAAPIRVTTYSSILKNGVSVWVCDFRSSYLFNGGDEFDVLPDVSCPKSEDDTLVFQCLMTVYGYGVVCSRNLYSEDGGRDVEELKNDYLRMLQSEELADVMIFVGQRRFTAHRCVLMSLAPKFFSALMEDILEGKIRLRGTLPLVLEVVLQSIYVGKVNKTAIAEYFQLFYCMAVQNDLRRLHRACTREMFQKMHEYSLYVLYQLAEGNEDLEMVNYYELFMKENLSEFEFYRGYRELAAALAAVYHLPSGKYADPSERIQRLLDVEDVQVIA